jgi:hypothetical protein
MDPKTFIKNRWSSIFSQANTAQLMHCCFPLAWLAILNMFFSSGLFVNILDKNKSPRHYHLILTLVKSGLNFLCSIHDFVFNIFIGRLK